MNKYLLFFLIVCFSSVSAQKFSTQYGVVAKDEIELTHYGNNAEAVVLFDKGKSYFIEIDNSFQVFFERTTRIKILSTAGTKWAEIEIPFYIEGDIYEKVLDIEAVTYNYDNNQIVKTPLNLKNTYEEKINNYWNSKKFVMPDVKEGSIIDIKYRIQSQYMFNLRDWEFQWKIPVVYSEYEVKMIPFYEYSWILQGANKFDYQNSKIDGGLSRQFGHITFNDMVHTYAMKNVPAFTDEEFITSVNDYIVKIDFQLSRIHNLNGTKIDILTTWDEMIKEFKKSDEFGKYLSKSQKFAPKLLNVDSLKTLPEKDKFDHVINYVKGNYSWNSINSKYALKSVDKFVKEKNGNCAEINLFTIGLLNSVGIESFPVLISTRSNGKIKYDYPFHHFFNYVIIKANVDKENVLADATEVLGLNYRIPSKCINDKGLIIGKNGIEWLSLECLFPSIVKTEYLISFSNQQEMQVEIKKTSNEYDALYYRNEYGNNPENIKKKLDSKDITIIDSSINVENHSDPLKPYILNYTLTSKTEDAGDKYLLHPFIGETMSDNPLKQSFRSYPLDMNYPKKRIFETTLYIPDSMKIEYLPENRDYSNELFELHYSTSNTDSIVKFHFEYFFKNTIYSPFDYFKVKTFFNEIVKKGNEKLVVVKKNSQ